MKNLPYDIIKDLIPNELTIHYKEPHKYEMDAIKESNGDLVIFYKKII